MHSVVKTLVIVFILLGNLAYGAVTVVVNGSNHTIPQTNEKGWGTNVTAWIQAISNYTLQNSGGTFTLTADTDFGANYGLKSTYYKSRNATPSTAGVFRLGVTESLGWRNNANSANLLLAVDGSDNLTFNGAAIPNATTGTFQDSTFTVYDNGDNTKKIAFQASGITTGTTRTLTVPDADITLVGINIAQTLTNKTLSGNTATNLISGAGTLTLNTSGTVTLPNATDTLVGKATTDTLTNKTLTLPAISSISNTGTLTLPTSTDTLVGRATTDTLTNKSISGATNTITNVSLTSGVTGVLPSANGGTAQSTWTTGDLLYASAANTLSKLSAGTSGYVLTSGGAGVAPSWAVQAISSAIRSVTTTDTATSADFGGTLLLSGASFTETLLTAVGNSGKIIKILHNGTSLTQIYSLATTSSQTIGGIASGSYALYTNGEMLEIQSDGANWQILNHKAETDWIDDGVITISATTTAPTKASGITVDKVRYRRDGRDLIAVYAYVQSNTTGAAAGSGDYKFKLPASLSADTTGMILYTTVVGNAAAYHITNLIGTGDVGFLSASTPVSLSLYDANYFRAFAQVSVVNGAVCSAANSNLTGSTITYNFIIRQPITGWRP